MGLNTHVKVLNLDMGIENVKGSFFGRKKRIRSSYLQLYLVIYPFLKFPNHVKVLNLDMVYG
ncbi:hypothetical protein HX13_08920 [Chryseobacterium sp. P1-3]|nr:hypothetical protein HX13_08920 [Chryseobacterium sp. P1-3]